MQTKVKTGSYVEKELRGSVPEGRRLLGGGAGPGRNQALGGSQYPGSASRGSAKVPCLTLTAGRRSTTSIKDAGGK